ncbi:BRCA1-associated RING domain protein 1-like [Leptopilina boulardi]|uniref:BRCA1-associated RING domain protein 1-like n=1 Tax=Leptopilina boulardi TaxID=63433 RepID=UPI0021F501DD|nr:BRCA1-associated RING domain protein 1-like [Leptopilina boulardi]
MAESTSWARTRPALKEFMSLLTCMKCKQRPTEPIKFRTCAHHFCRNCVYNDSECFFCGIPVNPSDIHHDFITANIISACDSIVDIVFNNGNAEDFIDDPDEDQIEEQRTREIECVREKVPEEQINIMENIVEEEKIVDHQITMSKDSEIMEFENNEEMEKENNVNLMESQQNEIKKKYRNTVKQIDEDEPIKKRKKIKNMKEIEKQIEISKFQNIERQNEDQEIDDSEVVINVDELLSSTRLSQAKATKSKHIVLSDIEETSSSSQTIYNTRSKHTVISVNIEEIPSSSQIIHNTRSKHTLDIIKETPSSSENEKTKCSDADTVILNDSYGFETMRSIEFNESKNIRATKSKKTTGRQKNNSLTKAPKIPKDINKKNKRGETPLHQACVKKQIETVKILLDNGANPNTKDNANWTPLQESVYKGYYGISKMLLENGAWPNTPGLDNRTALHEAVINNLEKTVKLLLQFDANPNVFDQEGKKPIDYCKSDEIKQLLSQENLMNNSRDLNSSLNCSFLSTTNKFIVLACNLQQSTKKLLTTLSLKHKLKIVNSFQSNVTHVVVESGKTIFLNYDLLLSVLRGKWILSCEWIEIGLTLEYQDFKEMDLDVFEIKFSHNDDAPRRARINAELQKPKLFNNCSFYFALNSNDEYQVEEMKLSKKNLVQLCLEGGGCSLSREPNPEGITDQRIPFHVGDENHPLHNCSHYIIYSPGKDEPRVKYNMPHIKTLPLVWFIECIEKFTLVDPALFGIV